jgi:hypothetical protein
MAKSAAKNNSAHIIFGITLPQVPDDNCCRLHLYDGRAQLMVEGISLLKDVLGSPWTLDTGLDICQYGPFFKNNTHKERDSIDLNFSRFRLIWLCSIPAMSVSRSMLWQSRKIRRAGLSSETTHAFVRQMRSIYDTFDEKHPRTIKVV